VSLLSPMIWRIAFRNIFRNLRRTIMTVAAIAVCAMTMILLGAYSLNLVLSFETGTIIRVGHLSIFKRGYTDFGSGNPGQYGIEGYRALIDELLRDPWMARHAGVVTPTVNLYGLASSRDGNASRNFYGIGWIPSEHDRMLSWDEHGVMNAWWRERIRLGSGLTDEGTDQGVIGDGLARILGLCDALRLPSCPKPVASSAPKAASDLPADIASLSAAEARAQGASEAVGGVTRIELLSVTANGSPNAASMKVRHALSMGIKELSDVYVGMHFDQARNLLYGRQDEATSIVIQLVSGKTMREAKARLEQLFAARGLALEVKTFDEITPLYAQVVGLFGSIFTFVAAIMVVISLFTVVNTMSMCVMERIQEIGTVRALGTRRRTLRTQFLIEGLVLGIVGSTLGCVLGALIARLVNALEFEWTPPGSDSALPLQLLLNDGFGLAYMVWASFVVITAVAAFVPAHRATRMVIVDALRHV
jgi:putative ABC transport system permease protein